MFLPWLLESTQSCMQEMSIDKTSFEGRSQCHSFVMRGRDTVPQ